MQPAEGSTSRPGQSDLQPVAQRIPLPVPVASPLACASLADVVHVVAMDPAGGSALHFTLDRDAALTSPVTRIPLTSVAGMVGAAGSLVVTGLDAEGKPTVVTLDVAGVVRRQIPVPVDGMPALWPQPIAQGDRVWLLWATGGAPSTLWWAALGEDGRTVPASLTCDDWTFALAAAGGRQGLAIARIHGGAPRLELLRLVDGTPSARQDLPAAQPLAPSLAAIDDQYALVWLSRVDTNVHLQWLDTDMLPVGPEETPAAFQRAGGPRSTSLFPGPGGHLAISYQTVIEGDDRFVRDDGGWPGVREHTQVVTQFVGAYSRVARALGAVHQIDEPGVSFNTGAWLGRRFLLFHGIQAPLVSVYEG